jgi:hypothetical protein
MTLLIFVITGLDPVIYAFFGADQDGDRPVDAHETSPWAEGPRIKSGHPCKSYKILYNNDYLRSDEDVFTGGCRR